MTIQEIIRTLQQLSDDGVPHFTQISEAIKKHFIEARDDGLLKYPSGEVYFAIEALTRYPIDIDAGECIYERLAELVQAYAAENPVIAKKYDLVQTPSQNLQEYRSRIIATYADKHPDIAKKYDQQEHGQYMELLRLAEDYNMTIHTEPPTSKHGKHSLLQSCQFIADVLMKENKQAFAGGPTITEQKAYQAYEIAARHLAETGQKETDRKCYDVLSDGLVDTLDYDLPAFGTWKRYVRKCRKHYGTQKNTPRAGRECRSATTE